jgi:hypothetical protein
MVCGKAVAGDVAKAVSVAGSSDFLNGAPIDEQAVTCPTSGARKKFCEATVAGGAPAVMKARPLMGAAAVRETHSDCNRMGA